MALAPMLCALFLTARAYAAQPHPASATRTPVIKASAAILVDAVSGQVLYARNPDLQRPPASTTKIMTAILLLEHTKPTDVIVASKKASEVEGSALHLLPGETVSAGDMLYALMLRSANDGCVATAEHVAGSEAAFVALMNKKAAEIGASRTHFGNANGLNCEGHVTTARDLATMARYASQYPAFCEATRAKFYTVNRSLDKKDVVMRNHDKLLWRFPGLDGVKTGYTVPAGHCFVGAATWNGWRLISVVLHSPDAFGETAQLLKYGFAQYQPVKAAQKGAVFGSAPVDGGIEPSVPAAAQADIQYVEPRGDVEPPTLKERYSRVQAPVQPGAVVGALEAWEDGRLVGQTNLVAGEAVQRKTVLGSVAGTPRGWLLAIAAAGIFAIRYGTAFAKTARRRGYRFASLVRGLDREG